MNQLQINPPEGFEIDQDKSDLSKGIVHFKKCRKVLRYEEVARELFHNKKTYILGGDSEITNWTPIDTESLMDKTNSTDKQQLESILALNKLCNVAKYLNDGWLPISDNNYYLYIDKNKNINVHAHSFGALCTSVVYFKTNALTEQAIEILGEDELRKALTLNH